MDNANTAESYAIFRQPIFDREKKVVAYNVEVRTFDDLGTHNKFFFNKSVTVDQHLTEKIKKIANGKKIFIHFDIDSIKKEIPLTFSEKKIGINIEDNLNKDSELRENIEKLKLKGFDLIIDGFDLKDNEGSMMNLADIFTVDFRKDTIKNKKSVLGIEDQESIKLLARDVETETDFNIALNKDFDYFQGNFFTRLDIIPTENIPSFKINLIKLLKELNKKKLNFSEIEEILKRDVALTFNLLKFMNSASLGIKTTITSINHALNLLGEIELKKWLSVMVSTSIGSDKPEELLRTSLVRAKFCEQIAEELEMKIEKNDYFLTGMFSLIDTFVGRPVLELLNDLPLKDEIKAALSGKDNHLWKVLELVKDFENGRWHEVNQSLLRAELSKVKITEFYNKAIEWSMFFEKAV